MTAWMICGIWFSLLVHGAGWIWGGRPERLAVGMSLFCYLVSGVAFLWDVDHLFLAAAAKESGRFLVIGWLCFRSPRWWPMAMTAVLCLVVLTYGLRLFDPGLPPDAPISARVGLGYLVHLILLLGVFERWLAGEPAAAPAAWAAAGRFTAARRRNSDEVCVS